MEQDLRFVKLELAQRTEAQLAMEEACAAELAEVRQAYQANRQLQLLCMTHTHTGKHTHIHIYTQHTHTPTHTHTHTQPWQ